MQARLEEIEAARKQPGRFFFEEEEEAKRQEARSLIRLVTWMGRASITRCPRSTRQRPKYVTLRLHATDRPIASLTCK